MSSLFKWFKKKKEQTVKKPKQLIFSVLIQRKTNIATNRIVSFNRKFRSELMIPENNAKRHIKELQKLLTSNYDRKKVIEHSTELNNNLKLIHDIVEKYEGELASTVNSCASIIKKAFFKVNRKIVYKGYELSDFEKIFDNIASFPKNEYAALKGNLDQEYGDLDVFLTRLSEYGQLDKGVSFSDLLNRYNKFKAHLLQISEVAAQDFLERSKKTFLNIYGDELDESSREELSKTVNKIMAKMRASLNRTKKFAI